MFIQHVIGKPEKIFDFFRFPLFASLIGEKARFPPHSRRKTGMDVITAGRDRSVRPVRYSGFVFSLYTGVVSDLVLFKLSFL